ncbi:LiaF transmembrane domain-containing protein [Paenibacillus puerhi]|uniref:LiaF transmembrane domain-containing protein n=1 Tax=Paenibacillus puerhi TaxID=2692622 RepID=UPI00135A3965|nr:hypothetical protein [Paenibacillus puerhi]
MRMNKHTGIALLMIFFGVMILLNKMGMHVSGHFMSYLFPIAMVGFGFLGLKNGKSVIGLILIGIGGLLLLGKLSGLIGLLFAGALIWYGVSLIRKKSVY